MIIAQVGHINQSVSGVTTICHQTLWEQSLSGFLNSVSVVHLYAKLCVGVCLEDLDRLWNPETAFREI